MGEAAPGVIIIAGVGVVTIVPVAIAALAAFLVRAPLLKPWSPTFFPDFTITILTMMGAALTAIDHGMSGGLAFWTGIGFGGLGSGIITIGKSALGGAAKARLTSAFNALLGIKEN